MTTIITKNSSTASAVPLAADLVQGELAVNVTDKRLFTQNASDVVVELGTNPSSVTTASATITGGTVNGTSVGATTPSTGAFTTLSASGNVTLGDASTDTLNVGNGGIVKDASGNVGIGTSSPATKLEVNVTGVHGINLATSGSVDSPRLFFTGSGGSGTSCVINNANGSLRFGRNATVGSSSGDESMRIDSSGNFLVGTTSAFNSCNTFANALARQVVVRSTGATGSNTWAIGMDATSYFYVQNQSGVGVFLAPSGTSWAALSDETTKDIIEPISNAAEKVLTLRAVIGKYKSDETETRRSFLIAQDVQKVLPEAVNEQPNGKLGLQYSDVIPLLTAAIQEQQAIIEALTNRITTLENK